MPRHYHPDLHAGLDLTTNEHPGHPEPGHLEHLDHGPLDAGLELTANEHPDPGGEHLDAGHPGHVDGEAGAGHHQGLYVDPEPPVEPPGQGLDTTGRTPVDDYDQEDEEGWVPSTPEEVAWFESLDPNDQIAALGLHDDVDDEPDSAWDEYWWLNDHEPDDWDNDDSDLVDIDNDDQVEVATPSPAGDPVEPGPDQLAGDMGPFVTPFVVAPVLVVALVAVAVWWPPPVVAGLVMLVASVVSLSVMCAELAMKVARQ